MSPSQEDITFLLRDWRDGDSAAGERLLPIVYEELRKMARRHMRREGAVTLQPTALVHEVYLRLYGAEVDWQDRAHFFALTSSMMRRILTDEAKRRRAAKRNAGETFLFIEGFDGARDDGPHLDILALDQVLDQLAALDERKAKTVELKYFSGLTLAECAAALGVGHATVERDLKMARAWLHHRLKSSRDEESASPAPEPHA